MLGSPCSPCCASCSITDLYSKVPEITVTVSTSGFSAGSPQNGGNDVTLCLAKDTGPENTTLWQRVGTGQFYEASGSYTLTPGNLPRSTTDLTGWPTIPGYVRSLPQVLGRTFGYSVNPHVGLFFSCGTQNTPSVPGPYLWAIPYVCLPIYTGTDDYTRSFTSGQWNLTAKSDKQYGTRENQSSDFFVPDSVPTSDWYVSILQNQFDPIASFGNLVVYFGTRPITRTNGQPVGITNYVEKNDLVSVYSATTNVPSKVETYEYVYFQGADAFTLVGETNPGGYTFYDNVPITSNKHRRITGVSTRAFPFVNASFSFVPSYSRFPFFLKGFISDNFVAPITRVASLLGWGSLPCEGSFRITGGSSYGKNTYEVPGTGGDVGGIWSGPTLSLTITQP
jgi:hypothetical protein